MKVALQRSGGFANIGAKAALDASALPKEKADELKRLVSRLPDQPPPPLRAARGADMYQYDITIDDGSGPKTYSADEGSMPDEWRALVDFLMEHRGGS